MDRVVVEFNGYKEIRAPELFKTFKKAVNVGDMGEIIKFLEEHSP